MSRIRCQYCQCPGVGAFALLPENFAAKRKLRYRHTRISLSFGFFLSRPCRMQARPLLCDRCAKREVNTPVWNVAPSRYRWNNIENLGLIYRCRTSSSCKITAVHRTSAETDNFPRPPVVLVARCSDCWVTGDPFLRVISFSGWVSTETATLRLFR